MPGRDVVHRDEWPVRGKRAGDPVDAARSSELDDALRPDRRHRDYRSLALASARPRPGAFVPTSYCAVTPASEEARDFTAARAASLVDPRTVGDLIPALKHLHLSRRSGFAQAISHIGSPDGRGFRQRCWQDGSKANGDTDNGGPVQEPHIDATALARLVAIVQRMVEESGEPT